ncbi:MAG TPA: MFS transporter [Paracoccaceae bacterium]|nr:MFS transporter [Paracoccaceae bacterium]
MRLLLSLAALFLSIVFVQLGSGALAPLDALGGIVAGFSKTEIGMLGSAHFVGFFVGCWVAPRMMGTVGHIRAFAGFATAGAIGALAHPLLVDPFAWSVMRVMTGFAVAGAYTVVESWFNAKASNATRGKIMGIYRVVDLGASLAAQVMIAVLEPLSYISYNLLAILCCLCLVPLTLTTIAEPMTPATPRLRPLATLRLSPLGAAGVIIAGVTMPAFRMVGPLYGAEIGLDQGGIASFLGAAVIGGALAQIPVGYLADRFDRRWVLIWLSLASIVVSAAMSSTVPDVWLAFAGAFAFGLAAFPVYSISAAHANDFAAPEFLTELNASLLFLYAVGAIASPYLSAWLVAEYGPSALFVLIGAAHVALAVFGLYRMTRRAPVAERAAYLYLPRTSFIIGRFLRRR